jgi:hypothetical protein
MSETSQSIRLPRGLGARLAGVKLAGTVVFAPLVLLGLWISFCHSWAGWAPDADMSTVPIVLDGVIHDGWRFLASWSFTQDNWLFSLLPLMAIPYAVIGLTPGIMILAGWLIFVGCVVMAGVVAAQISDRRALLPVIAVLLFANAQACGNSGYLTYAVTHNISLLFGMTALSAVIHAVQRGAVWAIAAACVLLFLGALSDPWLTAAFAIPLIAGCLVAAALNYAGPAGRRSLGAAASLGVALWLAETRLLGALSFLPPTQFAWGTVDVLAGNVGWLARNVAIVFNIVPMQWVENPRVVLVDCAAFLVLAQMVGMMALRRGLVAGAAFQIATVTAIVSVLAVIAALLLGSMVGGGWVGRALQNLYVLPVMLGAAILVRDWRRVPVIARVVMVGWASLFVVSGALDQPKVWTHGWPAHRTSRVADLAAFLAANGLHYGYGPYWGAEATAVTWITHGDVTIRPVTFDDSGQRIKPRTPQTSTLWYQPGDLPHDDPTTFLVLREDGEGCIRRDTGEALANSVFGPPARRLTFQDAVVLVWPHALQSSLGAP